MIVNTSWVYSLLRDDVVTYLKEFKLDVHGCVEELRCRLGRWAIENGKMYQERLVELEIKHRVPFPLIPHKETSLEQLEAIDLSVTSNKSTYPHENNSMPMPTPFQHTTPASQSSTANSNEQADSTISQYPVLKLGRDRVFLKLLVANMPVTATIDTGATRCFINQQFLHQLRDRVETVPHEGTILMGDTSQQKITQAVRVNLSLGDRDFEMMVIVLQNCFDNLILGLDFLIRANACISIGNLSINLAAPTTMQPPPGLDMPI